MNRQASVAEFYEKYGSAFAATRGAPWPMMREWTALFPQEGTVIDVGAGNGRLLDVLLSNVRYIGIEPSSTLRAAAHDRLVVHPQAEMREGGFPKLPLGDQEADVVTCIAVLHHLTSEERRQAVRELLRITKPGGRMIITVMNLRSSRWMKLKIWIAAWLRFPMVRGGGWGDVWLPWRANGENAQRYIHAFTLRELKSLFSDDNFWHIETCEARGHHGRASILEAGNLVLVARRKEKN